MNEEVRVAHAVPAACMAVFRHDGSSADMEVIGRVEAALNAAAPLIAAGVLRDAADALEDGDLGETYSPEDVADYLRYMSDRIEGGGN